MLEAIISSMRLFFLSTLVVTSVTCSSACDLKSSAFQALIKKRVEAKELSSKTDSRLCGSEWLKHGSCCEEESAKEYLSTDRSEIEQSNSDASSQLGETVENLKKFVSHIESSSVKLGRADARLFAAITKQLAEIEAMRPASQRTRAGCQSALVGLRVSALCAVCSARSSRYYFGDRLILEAGMCRAALGQCLPSWGLHVKVVDAMDRVKSLLGRLRHKFPKLQSLDFSAVAQLEHWLKSRKLQQQLARCDFASNTCPEAQATSICESMITFQQPTFAQVTVSVFREESTEMKKIGDFDFKVHRKVQVTKKTSSNSHTKKSTAADGSEVTETVHTHTHTSEKQEETTTTAVSPATSRLPAAEEWTADSRPGRQLSALTGRQLHLKQVIQRQEAAVFPSPNIPPGSASIPPNGSGLDGP